MVPWVPVSLGSGATCIAVVPVGFESRVGKTKEIPPNGQQAARYSRWVDVECLQVTDEFVIGTFHNVLLRVGRGTADAEHMAEIHRHANDLRAQHPEGIGFLLWLFEGAPIPDGAGRARAVMMFKDIGDDLRSMAAVIEGGGFFASAARSVLTGFVLMARTRFPLKIVSTYGDGIDWMTERLDPPVTAETLRQAVDGLAQDMGRAAQ